MKIKHLLYFMLFNTVAIISGCRKTEEQASPPNIILVYLDDMGYGDLSITGSSGYRTPNIDKLAGEGIFFTHYYSPQAVCSASRAGLLTGCYPNRIGINGALSYRSKIGLSNEEETIASLLKKRGYATAIFGKWHLGFQKQFLPLNFGFDEFLGIPYSNDMWPHHPTGTYPDLPLIKNRDTIIHSVTSKDQEQFTAQFTESALDFINRNKNNPFFIYLPHPMPHVPLHVSDHFKGRSETGMYGDVMMEIDWSVGQITDLLKKRGLYDNTLFIFTSDNGPWLNYGNHAGNTAGYREGKGTSWEGGQRVPCFMVWPRVIPEGEVSNSIVSGIDILPTLTEITGAPSPQKKIDGVSILPILKGDLTAQPRETFFYYYRNNCLEAVRHKQWKLVFPYTGRTYSGFIPGVDGLPGEVNQNYQYSGGLYDLRRDPGERYDVSELYPEIVDQLNEIAETARDDMGDFLTGQKGRNLREPGRVN